MEVLSEACDERIELPLEGETAGEELFPARLESGVEAKLLALGDVMLAVGAEAVCCTAGVSTTITARPPEDAGKSVMVWVVVPSYAAVCVMGSKGPV